MRWEICHKANGEVHTFMLHLTVKSVKQTWDPHKHVYEDVLWKKHVLRRIFEMNK